MPIVIGAIVIAAVIGVPASALISARTPERRRRAIRLAIVWPVAIAALFLVLAVVGPRRSHGAGASLVSVTQDQQLKRGGGGGSW